MRKSIKFTNLTLFLALSAIPGHGAELVNEGVLGNSGEAGENLVRFALNPRGGSVSGVGVVQDRFGFLWDRGGLGQLNRYAIDGRLVGQYKIPAEVQRGDQLTIVGDTLVLQIRNKLYSLPVTAPDGASASPLQRDSTLISFGSHQGKFASLLDTKLFLVEASTGTASELMTAPEGRINEVELLPDGKVALDTGKELRFFANGQAQGTKSSPGSAIQFLDNHWYGHQFHGTIKRFDAEVNAAPGVVLGGASGSFIGHLEGNYELSSGRGMAKVGKSLFAVSGATGVMHLLEWQEANNRFEIARRVGSLAQCRGLALDENGWVRTTVGAWKWKDGPATPQTLGSPVEMAGPAVAMGNGVSVVPALQYTNSARLVALKGGAVSKSEILKGEDKFFERSIVGNAAYKAENRQWLLLLTADGGARRYRISATGDYQNEAADVVISTTAPVKRWSGLAGLNESTLLAAADGHVIELARDGAGWKESRRWNQWDGDSFGAQIRLVLDSGRLWVSDSTRHRVLCFELANQKVLASYGTKDKGGDGVSELSGPTHIAARGSHAVVYDSGNQRLIKLALQ